MTFKAYHGVTAQQHQQEFNALSAQGYRMISISVYADPGNPRYAAVWVQRGGPPWVAVHGVDANGYQSFFNTWTARGYVPVLISATGTISDAVFAAMFEQGIGGAWQARHGLTSGPPANAGTFQNENVIARNTGLRLRSMAIYGTMADRRYAGIWLANPSYVKWLANAADPGPSYQATFDTDTQLPGYGLAGYRPALVTLSSDDIYCSTFTDDVVGEWVARHGMTSAEYQDEFNKQNTRGLFPICVRGGDSGSGALYAAVFAKRDIPLSREWAATGMSIPALAGLDHLMQGFMQVSAVRAAQLAVAKNGVMQLSRAYMWAEPGYPSTQVSTRFLLASCSKMFLAAAVQSLYDANKLKPSTTVYPLLGFSVPQDPGSDSITVQQLLNHEGGYDDSSTGSGFDPTYAMRQIALDLGHGRPATKLDVAEYMYKKYTLDFAPGSNNKYSNYGYLLASAIVEHVTGEDYFAYLNGTVLQPASINEVLTSSTLASQRSLEQAICEDPGLGLSPLDLNSSALAPTVYGGDGQIKEVAAGCAGLAASAQAMVRFIHEHAVYGNGGRAAGSARSGSTPGASTFACSRLDDVDWALTVNSRDWPVGSTGYTVLTGDDHTTGSINNLLSNATIP